MRPLLLAVLTVLVLQAPLADLFPGLTQEGVAQAQNNRRKAKKAYNDARKAYKQGKFATAAQLFKQAYEYDPKPQLLFNIGQALKEAEEVPEAITYYTRYLDEFPKATNKDQVLQTIFELQQLYAAQLSIISINTPTEGLNVFVDQETEPRCQTPCVLDLPPGTYTLSVEGEGVSRISKEISPKAQEELTVELTPTPDVASQGQLAINTNLTQGVLIIDGKPMGQLPMAETLSLPPGRYPAAISQNGTRKWSGSINIKPGEVTRLDLNLSDQAGPGDDTETGEDNDNGGGGTGTMSVAGFSLMGVGAGSLVAGTFFGLSASSIDTDLAAQQSRNELPNAELISQGETQALYANIFYGVGAVALTTGILLWVFDDGPAEQGQASLDEGLVPELSLTPGGAEVSLKLRF